MTRIDAPPRFLGALKLAFSAIILGLLTGAIESRWIAQRDFFPASAFAKDLVNITMHYMVLFGALGLVLGLLRRWHKPERVLCALVLLSGIWLIPYQATSTAATILGLVLLIAACALYLRSSTQLRRIYLSLDAALGLLLLAGIPAASPPPAPARDDLPNIVMVVIDTLRSDHLSCYGYRPGGKDTTPFIDSIAAQGTLFEKAYAQAPWTRPSAASLFTGLYPASHGIVTPKDMLGDFPTIATMLRARGYRTTAFSANPQVSPIFGFHPGFQSFWNSTNKFKRASAVVRQAQKWGVQLDWKQEDLPPPPRGVRDSDANDVNAVVFDWLSGTSAEGAPSFLYVHYLDPHDPYSAPEDLLGLPVGEGVDETGIYASQKIPPFPLDGYELPGLNGAEMQELQRLYDTEIRFVDDRFGKLVEELKQSGMLGENDYLIITSDHGEEFHEHGQWQHGRSLFDEMVHVPLIIMGPGIPAGRRVEEFVELVDILPTIAEWSGKETEFEHHGEALFGDREKRGTLSHRPRELNPIWSLRMGDRALIWVFDEERATQLAYDLAVDPGETTPLPDHGGDAFKDMRQSLGKLFETSGMFRRGDVNEVQLAEEMQLQLEQLGYIDR